MLARTDVLLTVNCVLVFQGWGCTLHTNYEIDHLNDQFGYTYCSFRIINLMYTYLYYYLHTLAY